MFVCLGSTYLYIASYIASVSHVPPACLPPPIGGSPHSLGCKGCLDSALRGRDCGPICVYMYKGCKRPGGLVCAVSGKDPPRMLALFPREPELTPTVVQRLNTAYTRDGGRHNHQHLRHRSDIMHGRAVVNTAAGVSNRTRDSVCF